VVVLRIIRNPYTHCMGEMQSYRVLKQVVHIITNGLERSNISSDEIQIRKWANAQQETQKRFREV
jgi:hypothetical protein